MVTELEVEPIYLPAVVGPRISLNLNVLAVELEKIEEMILFVSYSILR